MAYRLGIDLGSCSVTAAVAVDAEAAQLIMIDGLAQLPCTLYVAEDGSVRVGREAVARSAGDPGRAVTDPLQRLADDLPAFDDGTSFVAAESGVAALLEAALRAAVTEQGGPPEATTVAHPVGWDDYQRSGLLRAAVEAGLPECRLVADLEAAARQVVNTNDPGPGSQFLIMDLGGGSCSVGLARRTAADVELSAYERSDHPCGADFDEAVFRLVGGNLGDQGRELTKDDPAARARAREVRQACRQAREILSSAAEAVVTVQLPGLTKTVRIGRTEFESLVRPSLRDALGLATRLRQRGGVATTDLIGVALVGGGSRMPVVAELVEREWDLPVVVGPAPELDVALGLLATPGSSGVTGAGSAPVVAAPSGPDPAIESASAPDPEPVPSPSPGPAPVPPTAISPAVVAPAAVAPAAVAPGLGLVRETASAVEHQSAPPITPQSPSSPFPPDLTASGPPAAAPTTEQPMPENLIFDYFGTTPTEPLPAVAAGSAVASTPRSPRSPLLAASMPTPPQRPGGPYPQGQQPLPPGQRPLPPGQRPGPPTQPYGAGGGRPGGPGGFPPQSGGSGGPFGSRRNLILTIIGAVVLVGAAVGIGFWLAKPDTTTGTPAAGGQISAPPVSPTQAGGPATPSGGTSPSTASTSPSPSTSGSAGPGGGSSTAGAPLPAAAPLGQNLIVVPMRTDDDDEDSRPLYLVDSTGAAEPVKLPGPDGKLSNPMLQKDRSSIVFLEDGVLRVMASDGSGERDLADREPAGCDDVAGASWSPADPSTMVISCRVSKDKSRLLVVDTTGKLIRRLDPGSKRLDDITISPDGQTVLYWGSDSSVGDGGSLYTLPLVGTGAPKKVTSGAKGLDGDPSWSPDGSQIAFRRLVGGVGGNADVYVMNADGSGQHAVAHTKAADVKPIWSPDGKNLVVVSNRKSAFGAAGKTWDLWLTRVSDGEVIDNFNLKADEITTPTWSYR